MRYYLDTNTLIFTLLNQRDEMDRIILDIKIVPVQRNNLFAYAELKLVEDHKDPNDHMIIAQAISDKIPVIFSDRKFKLYENQGLQLVFNKR